MWYIFNPVTSVITKKSKGDITMKDLLKLRKSDMEAALKRLNSQQLSYLLKDLAELIPPDCERWVAKRQKSVGRRLRKATILLERVGKEFRHKSLDETKQDNFI